MPLFVLFFPGLRDKFNHVTCQLQQNVFLQGMTRSGANLSSMKSVRRQALRNFLIVVLAEMNPAEWRKSVRIES